MLKELQIKNVAVIDEVHIEFSNGFNVLTGETGAGKSILIDSINMALGSRVSHDLIRSGTDKATVNACFEVENSGVVKQISELGYDVEDGMVIISRQLNCDGKSVCRINGSVAPASVAREITSMLIDIHGQNDNQTLLCSKNHMGLLDEYGELQELTDAYRSEYKSMKSVMREIEELSQSEEEKARRLELLKFQTEEIMEAKLKSGEDEELESRRDYLCNIESIVEGAGKAYGVLYGGEEVSVYDLIRQAVRSVADICRFDETIESSYERLNAVSAEIEDIASDLNNCLSKTDYSRKELDQIEERLDLIGNLKRKYGNTIDEIIEYMNSASDEAEKIMTSDEQLEKLKGELEIIHKKVAEKGEKLSLARKMAASELEDKIMKELSELDMPKVRFAVSVENRMKDGNIEYNENGQDAVEFMISTNPGEELKPMARIASGGELSRIMLAVKSILADTDTADTMIFDEIDTGVSGRAAQKIAEKICRLARKKQILAITHLAQIAGMADNHYLIEKSSTDEKTSTSVTLLETEERIKELARIIGGVTVTELTMQNAREMIEMAKQKKAEV